MVGDDEAERRVLQRHDELSDDHRHHRADRLREKDERQNARLAQPDRVAGLALPAGQRFDAGADDLRQDRAVVGDERDHDCPVRLHLDADHGQAVVQQHHEDQDGHGAQDLGDPAHRHADPRVIGQASDREHEPENEGTDRRHGERGEGREHAVEDACPDRRVAEQLPLLGTELARGREAPDHPREDQDDQDDRAHPEQPVAQDRLGAGDVVQDGTHRAILHRRSSTRCSQANSSTSTTKMTITHSSTTS